jgi:uncharacterized protein
VRARTGLIAIERIESLVPVFAADAGIVLAFLFGSYAQGNANALSDVDLGLLLSQDVPIEKYLDYRLRYATAAMHALRDDRVDLVILNTAPPLLAHEAIKGRLRFKRSPEARVKYITDVQRKYLDLKSFYAIDYAYMRRRLKQGTFGQP